MLEQLLGCQIGRLPPLENRVGNIRRETAEADKTSEIGRAHAFALGKRSKGNLVARGRQYRYGKIDRGL